MTKLLFCWFIYLFIFFGGAFVVLFEGLIFMFVPKRGKKKISVQAYFGCSSAGPPQSSVQSGFRLGLTLKFVSINKWAKLKLSVDLP